MRKALTFAFALLLTASLSIAQTGGSTDKKSDDKKPAADSKKTATDTKKADTKKSDKKGKAAKGGKKSTGDTGTSAPK
jgi:hypothetical protein